jgi:plasmid stabilization system protein ParE
MPFPILVAAAEADIDEALLNTLAKWGEQKFERYIGLIEEALATLAENPRAGRPCPEIDALAWTYRIAKPGRRARHTFVYEIVDDTAHVYGLLYDGMDLKHRWRERRSGG